MSRNKNGLIHKRNCTECHTPTRSYRLVTKSEFKWSQTSREWLPVTTTKVVCTDCLHLVRHLDTLISIRNPELEMR